MNLIISYINNKIWLIVTILAVLIGFLLTTPQVLLWGSISRSGADFLLMQQNTYRDEFFQYMPRAREIYDGHFPPTGIYADELGSSPLNPITSLLFSVFLFIFNGNINLAYLSAQFLFAFVFFILFYHLGKIFLGSKITALFFGLVGTLTQIPQLLLGYNYIDEDYLGIIIKKFIPFVRTPISKMYFSRIDDPMLTLGFLILAILMVYMFWIKPTKTRAILAGLFSGLLAYIYLHYWIFMMVFIGILFVYGTYSFIRYRNRIGPYLLLCFSVFLILIPYIITFLNFNFSDYSFDYSIRLGKEVGRFLIKDYITNFSMGWTIVVNQMFYFVMLAIVYLFYFKKRTDLKRKGIFFTGLIATSFLVWYTPVLTGFSFALFHFNKPISLVFFIIISSLLYDLFKTFFPTKSIFKSCIVFFAVLLSVSLISKHIINFSKFFSPPNDQIISYNFPSDIIGSWKWIESNTSPESKIISDSLITSLYLGSYTSSRPYLASGFLSTLSNSELENRFLISNKLFEVPKETLDLRFKEIIPYDCTNRKCYKDTGINFDKSMWYLTGASLSKFKFIYNPDEVFKEYDNLVVDDSQFNSALLYYGPLEKQFSRPGFNTVKNLKLIYKNPSVEIYKVVAN